MITILLIIFLGIIICYTFRIYKLKKEGFSIFDGSFFDFGQQKMYMEFRKGGDSDQIGETNKGFTHEIKNIVGELGSGGGQVGYEKEGSFSQNLDNIQYEIEMDKKYGKELYEFETLKEVWTPDVLKIAILYPDKYDGVTMIEKAKEICKKGELSEFKAVDSSGNERKSGNDWGWFKDPDQGTHENVKCFGFTAAKEGLKSITFYGKPDKILDTWKKIKCVPTDVNGICENTYEKVGDDETIFALAYNKKKKGDVPIYCATNTECQSLCENLDECNGYKKNGEGYRLLKEGKEIFPVDAKDTITFYKKKDTIGKKEK